MESVFCHYSSTSQSFKSENAEVHCMPQVMIAHPHKKRVYIPKAHYHSLTHSHKKANEMNEFYHSVAMPLSIIKKPNY